MLTCTSTDLDHVHTIACYVEQVEQGKQGCSEGPYVRAPWEWNPPWEANVVLVPLPGYDARADLIAEFLEAVGQRTFKDEWVFWCSALWDTVLEHKKPRKVAKTHLLNRKTLIVYTCQLRTQLRLN